jgi:protein-S-isoprenylcysteine O-methyltransferase Ste14
MRAVSWAPAASIAGFVAMVAAIVGLFYVRALFSPSPIVIGVQLAAVGLMVWARITFGRRSFHATADPTAGGLVTTGPYRFVRHPIYTAACLFGWAGVAASASALPVTLGLLLVAGAILRVLVEERLLVERYPAYREYASHTKRMLPYVF